MLIKTNTSGELPKCGGDYTATHKLTPKQASDVVVELRAHEATREKSKRRVTNPTALKAKGEAAEARVSAARSAAARSAAARSAAARSAAVPLVAASGRHESREVRCGGESAAIVTRPSGEGRTGDRGRWLG